VTKQKFWFGLSWILGTEKSLIWDRFSSHGKKSVNWGKARVWAGKLERRKWLRERQH